MASPSMASTHDAQTNELMALAKMMAGEFTNAQQAQQEPAKFAHIHIFFRPLPYEFFSGIGFYSEQVYDYDLWAPYRQGIHRLIDRGDHIYVENYGLQSPYLYAGSGHNLDILKSIPSTDITPRQGCAMEFRRNDNGFVGSVEPGKACLIPKEGRMTYLTSHVEMTDTTWASIDQGMDVETDEYVWGSKEGMLRFEKRQSFASELPVS